MGGNAGGGVNAATGAGAATGNTSSGGRMNNASNSTNTIAPRADRGDSNSQGSNPNAPRNQPETTSPAKRDR
ncbi:MAG: hypothetical protein WKF71_02520 [Pyrinomonadaceae bacterium]